MDFAQRVIDIQAGIGAETKANMADILSVRKLFFTNVQMLGLDPVSMERKCRIPFNRDMFVHPNKKGFEEIMYFLFGRLNEVMCRQQFRDCWPVLDKKQEQHFRKVCNDWLHSIAAEDSEANLPRIVASLFMSPGGDKFYLLLMYFSAYVLKKTMQHENGVKSHEFLRWPRLTKQCESMSAAMYKVVQASTIRRRKNFLDHVQQTVAIQKEWRIYASELVKEYRTVTKDIRDLEQELKDEVKKAAERGAVRGSPVSKRKSGMPQYDYDVQNVKRAERIRKVRELWRNMENFHSKNQDVRDIVESIVEGAMERYKINGTELNVRVPDLLLRECEKEIQRRSVDNIYQGGKLNILSLVHLWNLSLHLYIERIHQGAVSHRLKAEWDTAPKIGLPAFDDVLPMVTTQVHTHHAHLTNAQQLGNHLKNKELPDLKDSVKALKSKLDSQIFHAQSPNSIRLTSLGLSLMPPTPPVNFSAKDADVGAVPGHEPIQLPPEEVSTPEAATVLMESIEKRIHSQQMSSLAQGTPIYAPRLSYTGQPTATNNFPTSKLPVRENIDVDRVGIKQRTRFRSAPTSLNSLTQPATLGGVTVTSSGTTIQEVPSHDADTARQAMTSQVMRSKTKLKKGLKAPVPAVAKRSRRTVGPEMAPKVEKSGSSRKIQKRPKAHDILADQIAEAVISGTPSVDYRRVIGGFGVMDLGQDLAAKAFESRDKLKRTPPTPLPGWPDSKLQDSMGPLSSTRLDHTQEVKHGNVDKIVTKLFSGEGSEDEGEGITTVHSSNQGPRPEPSSQRRHHPSGSEDPPAPIQPGGLAPLTGSPLADRVRDLNVGSPQARSPTSPSYATRRSFTLTSGAMVMTGDLLGMQDSDHLIPDPLPAQVTLDWSDHSDHSDSEHMVSAARVAELPDGDDGDDSDSSLSGVNAVIRELAESHTPELPSRKKTGYSDSSNNNNSKGHRDSLSLLEELANTDTPQLPVRSKCGQNDQDQLQRHITGAELNDSNSVSAGPSQPVPSVNVSSPGPTGLLANSPSPTNFDLLMANDDRVSSLPLPLAVCHHDQPQDISSRSTSNHGNQVDLDAEVDDLEELVNVSARVIELQNGSFTEKLEASPPRRTLESTETINTSRYHDTDQKLIASFVDSTLRDLSGDLGRITLGHEKVGSSRTPTRSRSPRMGDTLNKVSGELNAADIITRYQMFRQGSFGKGKAKSPSLPNGAGSRPSSQKASPVTSAPHTPMRSGKDKSPLGDIYLQRTPTKEGEKELVQRFALNLDDEDDDDDDDMSLLRITMPQQFEGGHQTSPLTNVERSHDQQLTTPLNTYKSRTRTPGKSLRNSLYHAALSVSLRNSVSSGAQGSPTSHHHSIPLSPLTDVLHSFSMDDSLSAFNILNEDDSVLLPPSPLMTEGLNRPHASPAVGKLIDL